MTREKVLVTPAQILNASLNGGSHVLPPSLLWRLSGLFGLDQFGGIESLGAQAGGDAVIDTAFELGCAAEDPEIFASGLADDGIAIVGIEIDDPVIAIERPEERDLELGVGVRVDDFGGTLG